MTESLVRVDGGVLCWRYGGAFPIRWEQTNTCRSEELIVASNLASILDEIRRIPMSASEVRLNSKVVHVELHQFGSGGGSITMTTDSEQNSSLTA